MLFPHHAIAQYEPLDSATLAKSVPFYRQFSFHTNVIDWGLAIPNVGVEWDFSGKPTSHYSLGVHVKYRPKMWADINPRIVLNVLQVRGEIRKYWRTFVYEDYDELKRDTTTNFLNSFIRNLRYKRLSGARRYRARNWRAYYWGLYGSAEKYTYNFDSHGRMGSGFSVGLTAGYTFPLYPMKNGASIDLDLGLSVGARMVRYDRFTYDEETHTYLFKDFHDWELVKRPVLEDAHVSLVYRFNSIDNKVRGYDQRFDALVKRWKDKQLAREDSMLNKRIRREAKKEERQAKAKANEEARKKKHDEAEKAKLKAREEQEKAKAEKETEKAKAKAEKETAKAKAKAEKEQARADKKKDDVEKGGKE